MRKTTLLLACCVWLCIGNVAFAQSAAPWLASDDWTVRALSRLHALGLTPAGFDAAAREHTAADVAAVFAHAWLTATARVATSAARGGDEVDRHAAVLRIVDGYVQRLAGDRSRAFANAVVSPKCTYIDAEIAAGLVARDDALLAGGFDLERNWREPRALPDYTTGGGYAELGAVYRNRVALTLRGAREGSAGRIERVTVDAIAGPLLLWGGRRAPGYAPLRSGGLVQYGAVALEGGGVRITRALKVPVLGALTGETFAGKLDRNGHVGDPWLWGSRLHVQPHARLDIGLARTAVFGALRDAGLGLTQLAEVVIGANLDGDFADDQVASIDARWRPPLRVPLELYGEWGAHDVDIDVLIDVPAFGVGARVAALPFAPALGIALEHTQINRSCCDNPPWYHHFELADGWTEGGVLLGHPLGGHGREWRVALDATLLDATLVIDAQLFQRTRGDENLFADARVGRSHGGILSLDIQPARLFSIRIDGAIESAPTWNEHTLRALLVFRP